MLVSLDLSCHIILSGLFYAPNTMTSEIFYLWVQPVLLQAALQLHSSSCLLRLRASSVQCAFRTGMVDLGH